MNTAMDEYLLPLLERFPQGQNAAWAKEMVEDIVARSDAAVCDHRLRYGGFGDFSGADLAARLIIRKHPAILVTQYLDQEADVAIRKFRPHLPVVLRRGQADEPDELRDAFARPRLSGAHRPRTRAAERPQVGSR